MRITKSTVRSAVKKAKNPLKSIARAASAACSKKNVRYAASLTKSAVRKLTKRK